MPREMFKIHIREHLKQLIPVEWRLFQWLENGTTSCELTEMQQLERIFGTVDNYSHTGAKALNLFISVAMRC